MGEWAAAQGGFDGDVVVRQLDERRWCVERDLRYRGKLGQEFCVPRGFPTDFASVPRIYTWLLPRYGRYTKAAILHDFLCQEALAGRIRRADADGLFRRANRELQVAFIRRWLMWAAVRIDAVRRHGIAELWHGETGHSGAGQLLRFLLVALPGVAFVLAPGVVIVAFLVLFWLVEGVAWLGLRLNRRLRMRRGAPAKAVNPPGLTWRL